MPVYVAAVSGLARGTPELFLTISDDYADEKSFVKYVRSNAGLSSIKMFWATEYSAPFFAKGKNITHLVASEGYRGGSHEILFTFLDAGSAAEAVSQAKQKAGTYLDSISNAAVLELSAEHVRGFRKAARDIPEIQAFTAPL